MTISQSRWGMNAEIGRNPIEPRKKDRPPMAGVVGGGVLGAAGYGAYHSQKTGVRRAEGQATKDWQSLLGSREALNAHNRKAHDVGVKIREYVRPKDMRFKAAKEAAAAQSLNLLALCGIKTFLVNVVNQTRTRLVRHPAIRGRALNLIAHRRFNLICFILSDCHLLLAQILNTAVNFLALSTLITRTRRDRMVQTVGSR